MARHAGDMDPVELADLAEHAAHRGAEIVREARDGTIRVAATKSTGTDLVTDTDRAVEATLIGLLTTQRPTDAVLGEESGVTSGSSGVTWIIDPIDGTTNFYYDLPGFNISVAAAVDGHVVAGVVVDPVRGETFRATRGGGATCNGRPLHGGRPTDLARSLIGTGFSYRAERRHAQARVVAEIIGHVRDVRRMGAAALDLCSVAAGRLDGHFESGLEPWDFAAGGLVAAEAGCHLGGIGDDAPDGRLVIAASPAIAADLAELLARTADAGLDVGDPSARRGWEFGRLEV